MNTATLLTCVSILTGYPIPETPLKWVEMPLEVIVDLAKASGIPNAYGTKALYLNPNTVWYAKGWQARFQVHEMTHHFQFHAGAYNILNYREREIQAGCVEPWGPWCDRPIPDYCRISGTGE